MENQKLTWPEITKLYNQEWIELVDFDWPEEKAFPYSGIVRVHAHSRKEFAKKVLELPLVDSAVVFVGERKVPERVVYNVNLHQWIK